MFIESLTPDQLVRFAQLLALTAFLGGLLGALASTLIPSFFEAVFALIAHAVRGPATRARDLRMSRRLHLIAARTARRELRKLHA